MNLGPLQLTNDDFWTDPRKTRAEIQSKYMRAKQEVLLFDAPAIVPIESRQTAPVQALRVASFATLRARPFRENAIAVAMDLDNNLLYTSIAVSPSDREQAPPPLENPAPVVQGFGSETFTIELRRQLGLPWEPGNYLARLIIGDEITEARPIRFQNLTGERDPEVEKFQEEERKKTRVPALMPPPSGALPTYGRDKDSPPLPEDIGITLAAPRVFPMEEDEPCILRASFRLPVLPRHIIPQSPGSEAGTEAIRKQLAPFIAKGQPLPAAVIPITLVGTGTETVGPAVWQLFVPVFGTLDPGVDRIIATGGFAMDLMRLEGFDYTQQTWRLYAFSAEAMAGPVSVGLTTKPVIPD